jgi:glyoxylase-like metal-dependent hydrolase (beta-lactamase superfamily II)
MFGRWLRYLLWRPFELSCRKLPLIPLRTTITEPASGVRCIRVENVVTRALSRFAGGYDYAVCYLVDNELLVDTGFAWARRGLTNVIRHLNLASTLRVVVNTHYHEDHTGNNDLFLKATSARILAHAIAVPEIRFAPEPRWYRRFLFGPADCVDVQPIPEHLSTKHFDFQVLHLPGHCPGHVCLFEVKHRWLFSGDLYIAPNLDSQLADAAGPDWITSLERAIELSPTMLFDAHGTIVEGSEAVISLLARKRDFLSQLRDRIKEEAREARSIHEITRAVFHRSNVSDCLSFGDGWLSLITGSDFSRGHLVKSFLRNP